MTNGVLENSRQALKNKRWDDVASLGREALASSDIDDMTLVNVGICARDAEAFPLADEIFQRLVSTRPDFPFSYYELGFSLMLQGRNDESVLILDRFLRDRPNDVRVGILLARNLHLCGDHAGAAAVVERLPVVREALRELCHVQSFGAFLREFPVVRSRLLVRSVARTSPMMSATDVAERLMAVKRDRVPFSLVRLGDGEGTCIRLNTLDEVTYEPLYRDNRDQFRRYWFGHEIDGHEDEFDEVTSELVTTIREADIVGLPLPGWLEHEYKIGSARGVSSLLNVYRLVSEIQKSSQIQQCAQSIHIDLGQLNFFDDFLRGEKEIGLISCFADLPQRLRDRYDLSHVDFHKIPGEQFFKDMIGSEATAGRHFPDVFEDIMSKLPGRCAGKIVLIAGGILGKLYAREVKRAGGIAVDIGSLADAWVKMATRPGYEKLGSLALR